MYCYRVVFILLVFISFSLFSVSAQTPESAIRHFNNGNNRYHEGDLDAAIEEFSRAIVLSSTLSPSTRKSMQNATGFAAPETDSGGITVVDPFTARAYCNRGLARFVKDDFDGAISDFNHALEISPALGQAYLNRGAAKRAKGDLDGSLLDISRAIKLDPRSAEGLTNRAEVLQELRRSAEAMTDVNRAISLKPDLATAYYVRGWIR